MTSGEQSHTREWALILGASSGFGGACAIELAKQGTDIFGVHLDRKATMANVERIQDTIRSLGREAVFFNINAADPDRRRETIKQIGPHLEERLGGGTVRILLHSLAFGTLRPFIAQNPQDAITRAQMDMTLDVMAHSLVYWTQELIGNGLMKAGGRIYAMTSAGGNRVWPTYGAVSAAKAALESHIRQLAMELAPHGITANAIRAGVTDTPALRKIPGSERMVEMALAKNPQGRMTTPQDVAAAIACLCHRQTHWLTGNVIGVDGGEDIVG